ncbi:hypothetical protein DSM112329_04517 [Paraconexibacter sp. AEG42_29]|uniref:Phospholipid/glycerol acyltransferase domain-containing protein n=1 Tax=Paraconexibacter sp. AEG42_29 TaxID=2997339 RepID=A0AAU7B149_9ACTN
MTTVDALLDKIYAADPGPQVVAAFDYDGTLISGFSAGAFYEHRIKKGDMGPIELARTAMIARRGIGDPSEFASFFTFALEAWIGTEEATLEALGEKLFKGTIASKLHHEAFALVEAHREMGHTLVLASSAMRFQTEPMARELGIEHVLSTEIEIIEGRITGLVIGEPLFGPEKARGLRDLAAAQGLDLASSFAYSNGREDIPFLEAVGHATAIEPDPDLHAEAALRGWPVLRCQKPPSGLPGPKDVARTAAFYGGLLGAMSIGAGVGLISGKRSAMADVGMGMGTDVSLKLAGVDVDVIEGEEHLWSHRPAIFLFNHQSKMDPLVVTKLIRERFTAVGKAQAKNVPLFGQFFQLAGMTFIDRSDNAKAREALAPVVEAVRGGKSLMISPEGTRTPTPRLAPFKKGPFHIAMQAGVPVVPIVLKGIHTVQSRGGQMIRPGRVEVVILPPFVTTDWKPKTVGAHADEVRDAMLDVLKNWPGSYAGTRPEAKA